MAALPLLLVGEGWAIATGEKKLVALSMAPLVVALLARRAWWPIGLLVAFVAVADPNQYRFGQATLPFFLMLAGLTVAVYRGFPRLEPIGWSLIVLVAATLVGIGVGANAVGLHNALLDARSASLIPAYWLAVYALERNRERTLRALALIAGIVSMLAILQRVAPSHQFFLSTGDTIIATGRIRPPGQVLPYLAFVFAASYLLWGPSERRKACATLAALTGAATLLTFNRDMIAGTVVGLLVAFIFVRPQTGAAVKLVVVAAITVIALAAAQGTGIGKRILTLGNPTYLQNTTLADRRYEDGFASRALHQHPILGVGWGASYGAQHATTIQGVAVIADRSFIHNQYLGLWLRDGILGLAAMVVALLLAFSYGVRAGRNGHWLGYAVVAGVVAIALSSVVGIFILDASSSVMVVCLLAIASHLRGPPEPT